MRRYGVCPKCNRDRELGDHHPFPQRFTDSQKRRGFDRLDVLFPEWFPGGKNNSTLFSICKECHCALEQYIPEWDMLLPVFYLAILESFLNGGKLTKSEVVAKMILASRPVIDKRRQEKGYIVYSHILYAN